MTLEVERDCKRGDNYNTHDDHDNHPGGCHDLYGNIRVARNKFVIDVIDRDCKRRTVCWEIRVTALLSAYIVLLLFAHALSYLI